MPEKVVKFGRSTSSPPTPPEVWPIVVRLLHKPTRNKNNQEIHRLTFRQPTARDIRRCGNPVRLSVDVDIIVDEKKMARMMSALSGLPTPCIDQLDARDWSSCSFFLQRFFLPEAEAWIRN